MEAQERNSIERTEAMRWLASEDDRMTRLLISAAAASSLALGGCATTPAADHQIAGTATGAVIGAGAGALAGSVLPGIGTATGAVAGAVLGGVAGAVISGRQYYRDTRGYCYYVDQYGQPRYNYNVRC
jgi:branched-subunit amino acid ABC-type transport system permease component